MVSRSGSTRNYLIGSLGAERKATCAIDPWHEHAAEHVMTQSDKSKQNASKTQPEGGKSIAGGGKGRQAKDEHLPGTDQRQGGKPFDKVRGGRT